MCMKLLIYIFEEQHRQYALLIENQKQQRARLEDQRQFGGGSSMVTISYKTSPKTHTHKSYLKYFLLVWSIKSNSI